MSATISTRNKNFPRDVQPEWLDTLAADDPRARRSRADLRRINWIMGALGTMRSALDTAFVSRKATHIVELGAGDGSLMARLARDRATRWPGLQVSLLDLQPVVVAQTHVAIERRGWPVEVVRADVFAWLNDAPQRSNEIIVANLFVHHFDSVQITRMFAGIAARASAFICCEPRRSRFALLGSRCVAALGCNDVTRHDAVASVHAGFCDEELTQHWPCDPDWITDEASAGLFLHRFIARRRDRT
jgi:Methyltransferase domain